MQIQTHIPRQARDTPNAPVLTARDDQLLRAALRYHFLTAEQFTRLYYRHGSLAYVRAILRRLVQVGCLQRLPLPRLTAGNPPWVYTLTHRSVRLLAASGADVDAFPRARASDQAEHAYLFLAHTLALNDVLIAAELLCRQFPQIELADVRHERTLRRQPIRVQLPEGQVVSFVPDAWLDARLQGKARMSILLELDRGTIEERPFKRKLASLLALVEGPYEQLFGSPSLTIAFVTTEGERRRDIMREWCEQVLTRSSHQADADLFLFASLAESSRRKASSARAVPDPETLFLAPMWRQPFSSLPAPLLIV